MKKILFNSFMSSFMLLAFALFANAQADQVIGKWVTIDDETNEKKSIIEIYEQDGKVFGKIIHLFNPSEPNPKCDDCKDDRKGQLIEGMDIVRDMTPKGDDTTMANGTICDPEDGKVYKCTMWRDGDKLMVRGWLGFFYRTQTWLPSE